MKFLGSLVLVVLLVGVYAPGAVAQKNGQPAPYYGPKKRIAVLPFEMKVAAAYYYIGQGLSEMATTALLATDRFIVVERGELAAVAGEQRLGMCGMVPARTEAQLGQLLGAQLLLKGAVTEFQDNHSAGGVAGVVGGVLGGLTKSDAKLAIDVRLIDTTTGQVVASKRAEGKTSSTGVAFAGALEGIALAGAYGTSKEMDAAARRAITEIVEMIVREARPIPWAGKIVKVDYGQVYINAGTNMNMKPGMVLVVMRKGDEIIDPDTGLSLGSTSPGQVGRLQITSVQDRFAICRVIQGEALAARDIEQLPGGM